MLFPIIHALRNAADSVERETATAVRPYGFILSHEEFAKLKHEIMHWDPVAQLGVKCSMADIPGRDESAVVDGLLIVPTSVRRLGRA